MFLFKKRNKKSPTPSDSSSSASSSAASRPTEGSSSDSCYLLEEVYHGAKPKTSSQTSSASNVKVNDIGWCFDKWGKPLYEPWKERSRQREAEKNSAQDKYSYGVSGGGSGGGSSREYSPWSQSGKPAPWSGRSAIRMHFPGYDAGEGTSASFNKYGDRVKSDSKTTAWDKYGQPIRENRHQNDYSKPSNPCPRQFQCQKCYKFFTTKQNKEYHEKTVHQHPRELYKCNLCQKEWRTRESKQKCELGHDNPRPYPCSQCSDRFTDISTRNRHERTQHSGYLCMKCGIKFETKREYNFHNCRKHL